MKILSFLFLIITFATNAIAQSTNPILPLIPKPKSIQINDGVFTLSSSTVIVSTGNSFEAEYLKTWIRSYFGFDLDISPTAKQAQSSITLTQKNESNTAKKLQENYQLEISKHNISISAPSNTGIFYGIQTMLQLFPLKPSETITLPCLLIVDQPVYSWRGMHLDVCRHFFPKAYIKRYIDYLAMYKMNTFHWHLTEDQGWRIEIKKYPKLTEIGAWRKGSMIGHYSDQKIDSIKYGGFYTQDDIREIVKYAQDRHITVVPEIELPGHSLAALAAYPEYSCQGGPFEVAKTWGVFDDVYCPKEQTFTFLEDILTEVMDLFPSPYIHIGGDECPKLRWKNCTNCQSILKKEGLLNEHELQSYFIKRIEKFINARGRNIIGWDEILEGGLAPNAAVMSWRGTQGGIDAAKQSHYVVMSPGSHCYFDHYQGDPKNEPIAIGGYTPIEKVYAYNPTPSELLPNESKYILGAQGNVWTEYINEPKNVDYMAMPRMAALSEVVWGTADIKQYKNFQHRLIQHFELLDWKGISYSKAFYEVTSKASPHPSKKGIMVKLTAPFDSSRIRYTLNQDLLPFHSSTYTSPLHILKSSTLNAAYFENESQKSMPFKQSFLFSKSTGKPIKLNTEPHPNYALGGAFTLVDGQLGDKTKYGRDWLGFKGQNVEAIIDLDSMDRLSSISITTMQNEGSWIHYPKKITYWVSTDGVSYTEVGMKNSQDITNSQGTINLKLDAIARYIKIEIMPIGIIPEGSQGAGSEGWLFLDEIRID